MADLGNIGGAFFQPIADAQRLDIESKLAPAELAQKAASTRFTSAEAEHMELENAVQKKMAALVAQQAAGQAQGNPTTISGRLNQLAQSYMEAGDVNKGAAILQQAAQAQSHESTARAADLRGKLSAIKLKNDQFKEVSGLLANVHDQASWDEANANFQRMTGQPSPFADQEYDPKLVQMLKDSSMTAYQKGQLKISGERLDATIADKESAIRHRAVTEAQAEARLNWQKQREANRIKAGGKDAGVPTKVEVDQAYSLIGDQGLSQDDRDTAATSIASDAKLLRHNNPALSMDEAIRQTIKDAKAAGAFQGQTGGINVPFFGKVGATAGKFDPDAVKPLAVPASKDQLKVGKVYQWPNGLHRWTKNGWEKVEGNKKPTDKPAPPSSDDEDDDNHASD